MQLNDNIKQNKLKQIYEKYKNRMYISACKILGDPYKAEDAVHDSIIAISKNLEKINDIDSVSTASYVIKATKNTALNHRKRNSLEILSDICDEDISSDENLLDSICTKENYHTVVSAIENLDEKYRDVLSLYYLNELTVSQIADLLLRNENTVKQQLARGRRQLINSIEKEI